MRKNPGRQIRTYSERLDEYFDGVLKGEPLSHPRKSIKTDTRVLVAPLSSIKPDARLTTLIPSSIFDGALAGGMNTLSVCFVSEQDYKFFVKIATKLKVKQRTLFVVKAKRRLKVKKTRCGQPHVDAADGPIWCFKCQGPHPLQGSK